MNYVNRSKEWHAYVTCFEDKYFPVSNYVVDFILCSWIYLDNMCFDRVTLSCDRDLNCLKINVFFA